MFKIAESTNTDDFVAFLKEIRAVIDFENGDKETYVVVDNHKAHHSQDVKDYIREDMQRGIHEFRLMYMPPYSCQFNA
jgi:hypothetical protein